jgi:hypothetical protein
LSNPNRNLIFRGTQNNEVIFTTFIFNYFYAHPKKF